MGWEDGEIKEHLGHDEACPLGLAVVGQVPLKWLPLWLLGWEQGWAVAFLSRRRHGRQWGDNEGLGSSLELKQLPS